MNRLQLIENINSLKLIQKKYWEDVEFPEEIQDILNTCEIVENGLYIDKHRWYETSITVYKLNEEYFGITYVTDIFSESSSVEDMFHTIRAVPMKSVVSTTFIKE